MSLIVQKFGGSSLADAPRIRRAASIVQAAREAGHDVIVIVSAQGNTTDELLCKAKELHSDPPPRELDALLATGENASAALLATTLRANGVAAVSLSAWQAGVRTEDVHGSAQIRGIERARTAQELARGNVVVAAGFQGVDSRNDLTTLGRGGSDTSAVAFAAEFQAERCVIYTDVDGVYTADPRICPDARRLERVSFRHMHLLAEAGAQVLHGRSVELAERRAVALEVRSCEPDSRGTAVTKEDGAEELTGVARRIDGDRPLAVLTVVGRAVPSLRYEKAAVTALSAADVDVCAVGEGEDRLLLYVPRERADAAVRIVHRTLFSEA